MQDDALTHATSSKIRIIRIWTQHASREYSVSVWSIIGHLRAVGGEVARIATDYALPCEAVEAAIVYYRRYKNLIDARIAANAA